MTDRRAVVTGGAGFVGSHLCEQLVLNGWRVVCVDDLSTGRVSNISHLIEGGRLEFLRRDISQPFDIEGPVNLVLHFASPASPLDYARLPIHTLRVGAYGTLHALELAQQKQSRFVLASTSEAYGDPLVHPQPESYWGNVNPVGPRSVYDEAKRYAEAATAAHQREGANAGIVRIFNTYGPRMRGDDGRAVPTFITQALSGQPLSVAGDGTQTRSLCYVDDLVAGILAFADSDLPGPCNLGNPGELRVIDIADLIRQITGSDVPLQFVERPTDDPELRRPDISLALRALEWEPRVDARTGLTRTIEWFRGEAIRPSVPSPAGAASVNGAADVVRNAGHPAMSGELR